MGNPKKNPTQSTPNPDPTRPTHTFSGLGFWSQNPTQPTPFRRVNKTQSISEMTDLLMMKSKTIDSMMFDSMTVDLMSIDSLKKTDLIKTIKSIMIDLEMTDSIEIIDSMMTDSETIDLIE